MTDYCGCCGNETGGELWCERCLSHIARELLLSGRPWERTHFAQTGEDCPFQNKYEDLVMTPTEDDMRRAGELVEFARRGDRYQAAVYATEAIAQALADAYERGYIQAQDDCPTGGWESGT